MTLSETQRRCATLLAQGVPAMAIARQSGMPDVRTISRWKKVPEFQAAIADAAAGEPGHVITGQTPVEKLRELARSPREDIALRSASKLADLEAKAAIEEAASQPRVGATIFVAVHRDGSTTPHEVSNIIRDLEPGSQPILHLERHARAPVPYQPHPDPVRWPALAEPE